MIGPVESALRAKLAEIVNGWPVRWPNEAWPDGLETSDGNMPIDGNGRPSPAIECEVIAGQADATVGPKGFRRGAISGLFRCYLSVGQGTGTAAITAQSDAIADAFRRVTVSVDPTSGARLITMDPRADDGVAGYEEGDRYIRMLSIPWDFDYPD